MGCHVRGLNVALLNLWFTEYHRCVHRPTFGVSQSFRSDWRAEPRDGCTVHQCGFPASPAFHCESWELAIEHEIPITYKTGIMMYIVSYVISANSYAISGFQVCEMFVGSTDLVSDMQYRRWLKFAAPWAKNTSQLVLWIGGLSTVWRESHAPSSSFPWILRIVLR